MQRASDQHREDKPDEAAKDQQQAIDDLQKALEEVEKALAQLREEEREELLAALEARFREILARHRPITTTTVALDEVRAERPWERADRLRLGDIAREEELLAELVRQALDILVEDGTTVIFPRIVSQLREDMLTVQGRLVAEETGAYTQALEREIEQTLEEIIEALERAQQEQENQGQPGQQGQQGQPPLQPLVPNSAELKLLKSAQLRVNRRTKSFDEARPAPSDSLDEPMRTELRKIETRQEQVSEMAEEMIERY
jgi:hypothetical protein